MGPNCEQANFVPSTKMQDQITIVYYMFESVDISPVYNLNTCGFQMHAFVL